MTMLDFNVLVELCLSLVIIIFIAIIMCIGSVGALRYFVVLLASLIGPTLDQLHFFAGGIKI